MNENMHDVESLVIVPQTVGGGCNYNIASAVSVPSQKVPDRWHPGELCHYAQQQWEATNQPTQLINSQINRKQRTLQ